MLLEAITIATYNIAGNHKTFDYNLILSALRSLNADVICLQEVSGSDIHNTQAHSLANDLCMNCEFGQADNKRIFGNAIISRFPLTHKHNIELPRGSLKRDNGNRMPGQKETRGALAVVVSPFEDAPEYNFLCICTHVGLYNSADKVNVAKVPGSIIERFVNDDYRKNMPALLAGDFNCKWSEPFTGIVERLNNNWNFYKTSGTKTSKSDSSKNKIDYICDRQRGKWTMESNYVVRNENTDLRDGHRPSDHLPLVAVWKPAVNNK